MNNYYELIKNINGDAAFRHILSECGADGCVWFDKRFICDYVSRLKYAIEQLCADVARLEAENRAKEQYIAETIGKVIKERDAAIADLRYQSACWNCTKNGKDCHANVPMEQPNVMCGGFEWRGERRRE